MPLPCSGGAALRIGHIGIRFAYKGCANRPFYHVVIQSSSADPNSHPVEQIGSYDPMPNSENQKLLGLNLERLEYWLGRGAEPTRAVQRILGLAGLLPIHHETIVQAWENRKKAREAATATTEESPDS